MRCPACLYPSTERDEACKQCGLTLEGLMPLLGIPPLLEPPLSDPAGILTRSERASAMAVIRELHQEFPQISFSAVILEWPSQVSASLMAFWLFNKGSLFSAVEKAGDNYGVLLLQDPIHRRSAAMIGYGLEPFIPDLALSACLTAASPSISKARHGAGIESFVRELHRQFKIILRDLPRTFGLTDPHLWHSELLGETEEQHLFDSDPEDRY